MKRALKIIVPTALLLGCSDHPQPTEATEVAARAVQPASSGPKVRVTIKSAFFRGTHFDNSGNPPDFFAAITIGTFLSDFDACCTHVTSTVLDRGAVDPAPLDWHHVGEFRPGRSDIGVSIALFDNDFDDSAADRADITERGGDDLDLVVELNPCRVMGRGNDLGFIGQCNTDLSTIGQGGNQAEITIRIEVGA